MTFKDFFRPTKSKIIVFIIVLVLCLLSNGLKISCIGSCGEQPVSYKIMNAIPSFTSPGIHALAGDNGFFMNYKPYGTPDMVLEIIFHAGIDLVYWYILSCLIIALFGKRKSKK